MLFDNNYELLHDRIDIRAVQPITAKEYYVGGCTALLGVIGKTIHKIGIAQKNTVKDYCVEKVMFGISADKAVDYVPEGEGTELNFRMMSETVSSFRSYGVVSTACLDEIRSDVKTRGGRK